MKAPRYEMFKGAMATLGIAFGRDPEPLLDVYWTALADLGDIELAQAFATAVTRSKFFPVPAELREYARPGRTTAQRAAVAWAAVRAAIRTHDYTVAAIDFGPLVNSALRAMGSWEWFCEQTPDGLMWAEKTFTRYFDAFASGPPAALRAEPLEGWGRGRVGCPMVAIPIEGEAAPARLALPAPAGAAVDVVRRLADEKSQPGAAGSRAVAQPAPPPPREVAAPVAITPEEKAAAVARADAQLAAWRARQEDANVPTDNPPPGGET